MDPCKMCCDYPYWCRGICIDKTRYINEMDEDVPVIAGIKRVVIDINKNGIRRETYYGKDRLHSRYS